MQLALFTLLSLAGVTALGLGMARALAAFPLSLLERAYENGRFAGLGSEQTHSHGDPAAGMPIVAAVVEPGYAS